MFSSKLFLFTVICYCLHCITSITDFQETLTHSDLFLKESKESKLKMTIISGDIDLSLSEFEKLFINEEAPYSYKRYHETVNKDKEVVSTNWLKTKSDGSDEEMTRDIQFFKNINLPGLASARGTKYQKVKRFGNSGLILYSSTKMKDVPANDCFSVDDIITVLILLNYYFLIQCIK